MKQTDLELLIDQIKMDGYEKEIPIYILKKYLARYVGIDKYRLKYTLQTVIELGYFSNTSSPFVVKINQEIK